jgi:hypothetical protein
MKKAALALLLILLLGAAEARAQCAAGTRRVAFPQGRTTAVLKGRLAAGKDYCYRLRARAGQRMTVHLTSPGRGVRFSVFPPSPGAYAVAAELADWEGALEEDGDYMISVTLPRGRDVSTLEVTIR